MAVEAAVLEEFTAESREQLDGLEQSLLRLETEGPSPELLKHVFRLAHTFKGNCAVVGLDSLAALAHAVEGVLEELREGSISSSVALVDSLLKAVDAFRHAVAGAMGTRVDAKLEGQLQKLCRHGKSDQGTQDDAALAVGADSTEERSLRVSLRRLDRGMNLITELTTAKARLSGALEALPRSLCEPVDDAYDAVDRLCEELREHVVELRMVPIGPVFRQSSRMVRDVAASLGKKVALSFHGEHVELDASIVERMRDPLTQMIRNALDHGIEPPALRTRRGKDPVGQIALRAFHQGGQVVLEVADDGAGLSRARILERVARKSAASPSLSDEEVFRFILEPGFTTAESVTELSGRGVGMDVVRQHIEALGGTLGIRSKEENGTTFTVRLPLTLAIIQGLSVNVAMQTCVVPVDSVVACVDLSLPAVARGVVSFQGQPVPYVKLRQLFGFDTGAREKECVVVVRHEAARAGLVVDGLRGQSPTVVKSLGRLFRRVPGISGSSVESDGRVSLILDVAGLVEELSKEAFQCSAS